MQHKSLKSNSMQLVNLI